MRIPIATILIIYALLSVSDACEEMTPATAGQAIRNGDMEAAYCGIESLIDLEVRSYPVLVELLADDSPFYWFCGHSAKHMRNDPIKLEDPTLVFPSDGIHQSTVAQVAAYIVIAVELGDPEFAEYCVFYPVSERIANSARFTHSHILSRIDAWRSGCRGRHGFSLRAE